MVLAVILVIISGLLLNVREKLWGRDSVTTANYVAIKDLQVRRPTIPRKCVCLLRIRKALD